MGLVLPDQPGRVITPPGKGEACGVEPRGMQIGADQRDRPVGQHRVQQRLVRGIGPQPVPEPVPVEHGTVGRPGPLPDQVGDGPRGRGTGKIEPVPGAGPLREVDVRVPESRKQHPPIQVELTSPAHPGTRIRLRHDMRDPPVRHPHPDERTTGAESNSGERQGARVVRHKGLQVNAEGTPPTMRPHQVRLTLPRGSLFRAPVGGSPPHRFTTTLVRPRRSPTTPRPTPNAARSPAPTRAASHPTTTTCARQPAR